MIRALLFLGGVFLGTFLRAQTEGTPAPAFSYTKFSSPLLPHGVLDTSVKGSFLRNFLMSKRFKLATYQRDSLYQSLMQVREEKKQLSEAYEQDTAQRAALYRQAQQLEQQLRADIQEKEAQQKKCQRDYLALSQDFRNYRDASLSEQDRLKMNLVANQKELERKIARMNDLERMIRKRDSSVHALRDLIKSALLSFDPKLLSVSLKNGQVYVSFSEQLLFQSASAEITNAKALDALKTIAEVVNKDDKLMILIEGHTDSLPIKNTRYADNWDLGAARAIAVVRLLSDFYSVSPARLTAASRSSFVPRVSNTTPEGRAENRRVEVILIPNLEALYKEFSL